MAAGGEAELSRLARQAARTQLLTSAVTGCATVLVYAALVSLQISQQAAIAGFATALLAIRVGTAGLQRLVTGIDQLYEQSLFFGDWVEACREAERMAIPARGKTLADGPWYLNCGVSDMPTAASGKPLSAAST